MNRMFLFLTLTLLFTGGFSKNLNAQAIVNEVDSLLQLSINPKLNFEEASQVIETAKMKAEAAFGKSDTIYATCLFYHAIICDHEHEYSQSSKLFKQSQDAMGAAFGNDSVAYIKKIHYLVYALRPNGINTHYWQGKGQFLNQEYKRIAEKYLGKESPMYAMALQMESSYLIHRGQYEKAEPLALEAKNIKERTLGKEHIRYAESLFGLGIFYNYWDKPGEAAKYFEEGRAFWLKKEGKQSDMYIQNSNFLAESYLYLRRYEEAEALLLDMKKTLFENDQSKKWVYVNCFAKLIQFYETTGRYEEAEKYFLEWIAWHKARYGENDGFEKFKLAQIGYMYASVDQQCDKVEAYITDAYSEIMTKSAQKSRRFSSAELFIYANFIYGAFTGGLIATHSSDPGPCQISGIRYDIALFFKGYLLESASRLRNLALADPGTAQQYRSFQACHAQLAKEYAKPIAQQQNIESLEIAADSLDKNLALKVKGYSEASRIVTWKEVQQKLRPGEAALEFMHYGYGRVLYSAVLLLPNINTPLFFPLFEEKHLDSLLLTFGQRGADYVNGIYSASGRGVIPAGKPEKTLYEMLWQPIVPALKGTQTIFYSNTGLLHRINLAALPINYKETLADRYRLIELGSTRNLVVPNATNIENSDAFLFGGIQYEMDANAISYANAQVDSSDSVSPAELIFESADSTLAGGSWQELIWADEETTEIDLILTSSGFRTTTMKGFAATEKSFKNIGKKGPSPRILHLATHGFFFPDIKQRETGQISGKSQIEQMSVGELNFKRSEHPMIRSGLILAGANYAWETGKPFQPNMEDGILTAYEISQMNLRNTELVVLSACETGLGDIEGSEGVFGLQRAFKIAGAKYLIMSLWQVPDKQTSLLMTTFYKKWLEDKMEIPEAFRATQKELRDFGLDPYQWAGFVLME